MDTTLYWDKDGGEHVVHTEEERQQAIADGWSDTPPGVTVPEPILDPKTEEASAKKKQAPAKKKPAKKTDGKKATAKKKKAHK